jgi:hypothetical protein
MIMAKGKEPVEVVATIRRSIEVSTRGSRRVRCVRLRDLFGIQAWSQSLKELVATLFEGQGAGVRWPPGAWSGSGGFRADAGGSSVPAAGARRALPMVDMTDKLVFRIGYESISVPLIEVAAPGISHEKCKFVQNYIIRDIYIFLKQFDNSIFDEYMKAITTKRGRWDYGKSDLSSESVDSAVSKVFSSQPQFLHTYFLSKICHFFFFGIRCDLTRITPRILDSFTRVINLHEAGYDWPYPPELKDAFYSLHEFVCHRRWPLSMLTRHFYICFAELYEIAKKDLSNTVGSDLPALEPIYQSLIPLEYTDIAPESPLNNVIFDDTYAYFAYLRANYPHVIRPQDREEPYRHLGPAPIAVAQHAPADGTTQSFVDKYKALPNIEKLKYVRLANNLTRKEIDFVKINIAPVFELASIAAALVNERLKSAFIQAHEDRGEF